MVVLRCTVSVTMVTEFPAPMNTNEFVHTELVNNNNDKIGKCKDKHML